mgnify:CR=1 FL=1
MSDTFSGFMSWHLVCPFVFLLRLLFGITECPCTTRIKKVPDGYLVQTGGTTCREAARIKTADACLTAGVRLGVPGPVQNVSNAAMPGGCLVQATARGPALVFNNVTASNAPCTAAAAAPHVRGALPPSALVSATLDIDAGNNLVTITLAGPATRWFAVRERTRAKQTRK